MDKATLRTQYKQLRQALSPKEVDKLSIKIAGNLLPLLSDAPRTIHLFLPIQRFNEINTYLIKDKIEQAFPKINWVISRSNFETGGLHSISWNKDTQILVNQHGIPEPQDGEEIDILTIDVVLVPLLAFDNQGHRLGYGKGFYDRFLANCSKSCRTIGLSLFDVSAISIPADTWDVPLHFCVTPEKTYRF